MKFASVRLIAADMKAMVAFYELVTGQTADWLAPQFAEIVTPAATLAIGSAETVAAFAEGSAQPGANRTAILEFMVDDIDAAFDRLKSKAELVHEPKLLPWAIARSRSVIPRVLPSASSCRSPTPPRSASEHDKPLLTRMAVLSSKGMANARLLRTARLTTSTRLLG